MWNRILIIIFSILLCSSDAFSFGMFAGFDSSSDGVECTVDLLNASTLGITGSETWSITGTPMAFSSSASKPLLPGTVGDGSTWAANAGSLGVKYLTSTYVSYLKLDLSSRTSGSTSIGVWYYTDIPNTDQSLMDIFTVFGAGGADFANAKFLIAPSGLTRSFQLETGPGGGTSRIDVSSGQWYWITIQFNNDANHVLNVYNASMELVGSINEASRETVSAAYTVIGQSANSGAPTTGYYILFDSMKIDFDGYFPLLPIGALTTGSFTGSMQ
jgi:hypothetical protein